VAVSFSCFFFHLARDSDAANGLGSTAGFCLVVFLVALCFLPYFLFELLFLLVRVHNVYLHDFSHFAVLLVSGRICARAGDGTMAGSKSGSADIRRIDLFSVSFGTCLFVCLCVRQRRPISVTCDATGTLFFCAKT
jgi:hypothetical protein